MKQKPEIEFDGIKFEVMQYRMSHFQDSTDEWVSLTLDKENLEKFLNANVDEYTVKLYKHS